MFFALSKFAWFLASPVNALLFLLAVGVLAWPTRFARLGRRLAALAAASLLLAGFSPLGPFLLRPLENRFPQVQADAPAPTGIVVLGGSTDTVVSDGRGQVTLTDAAARLTAAVELARRYPDARLVFSGGSGLLFLHGRTEAEDTRRLWIGLGIAPERISLEDRSRNTYENAVFTKRLVEPKPGENWMLVTSAFHMPRSVGLFRAVDFPVIPYPVDYRTAGNWRDLVPPREASLNFRRLEVALREWAGLLAYRLTGRTRVLFPAP